MKKRCVADNVDGSSSELFARARQGDRRAYAKLYEMYRHEVWSTTFGILRNREDTEDTNQTVWVKFFEALSRERDGCGPGDHVRQLLLRIAINESITLLRKRMTKKHGAGLVHAGGESVLMVRDDRPLPDEEFLLKEVIARIRLEMKKLPPRERECIELHLQGLPSTTIAESLQILPGAERVLHHRALTKLRKGLEDGDTLC